ncbi:MAG: SDR family oxidoreductase [Bacteroidetes bacterium]|nr:SDR family oxidoreductase [Bacteroidota bacterium]
MQNKSKNVIVLTGAGQLGVAIVRRMAYGNKIFIADWKMGNAEIISKTLVEAGFNAVPYKTDISSRESILELIEAAKKEGEIAMFINAAGLSPSQSTKEHILAVDLYGTAVLLEEFGKVIKKGGSAVTISSQSGHRMPALSTTEDRLLAITPTEDLLNLEILKPKNIKDTLHAYQMAKRCNVKRVMAEAVKWGERGARVNSISPGIIITPLALDEINGPRGDFYKNMFAKSPAGRPGMADEVANVAELLLSERGAFITGADFLIDGGATASYFYGPLQPEMN